MKILIFKNEEQESFEKYDDPKQVQICADNKLVQIYNFLQGILELEFGLISKKVVFSASSVLLFVSEIRKQ